MPDLAEKASIREWTVLPYFRSPQKPTVRSLSLPFFTIYCQDIGKGLSRMVVTSVSGVDHRDRSILGRHKRSSFL